MMSWCEEGGVRSDELVSLRGVSGDVITNREVGCRTHFMRLLQRLLTTSNRQRR
jgi:hypothetical protein